MLLVRMTLCSFRTKSLIGEVKREEETRKCLESDSEADIYLSVKVGSYLLHVNRIWTYKFGQHLLQDDHSHWTTRTDIYRTFVKHGEAPHWDADSYPCLHLIGFQCSDELKWKLLKFRVFPNTDILVRCISQPFVQICSKGLQFVNKLSRWWGWTTQYNGTCY